MYGGEFLEQQIKLPSLCNSNSKNNSNNLLIYRPAIYSFFTSEKNQRLLLK